MPMAAGVFEAWVFGHPIEEVVLWKHGETGTLLGDGADVADGFLVVCFKLHGLCCDVLAKPCGHDNTHAAQFPYLWMHLYHGYLVNWRHGGQSFVS